MKNYWFLRKVYRQLYYSLGVQVRGSGKIIQKKQEQQQQQIAFQYSFKWHCGGSFLLS